MKASEHGFYEIKLSMGQQDVEKKFNEAEHKIRSLLVPVELLSQEQSQSILRRYVAALEKNFQYWLATTLVSSCSEISRDIAEENFQTEVQENHCLMLRQFGASAGAEPGITDYRSVAYAVERIHRLVAEPSFIPILMGLPKK